MSMLVRKVTIIRPGRNRRAQSQRTTSAKSTARDPHGGGISGRTSLSRSTLSGVFQLKSSSAKAGSKTPALLLREQTYSPGRQSSSSSSGPGGRSAVQNAEQFPGTSGGAVARCSDSPTRACGQQNQGRNSTRHPLTTDLGRHFLSPLEPVSVARSGVPFRHVGSSLKESDLSKPESDLPFTRADLPVRHSSLPARRLDCSPAQPQPPAASFLPPSVLFGPPGPPGPPGLAPTQCSLPQRYLDLPRSHLDYPLRRPDSEQAYRQLAEQEQLHRSLIASMCFAHESRGGDQSGGRGLLSWDGRTDLYQATEGWRRPSLETTQHSEFFQQVLEANKDADGPCDFVCRVTDILSTTMLVTALLFLVLAVPVIMIAMGVKYLDDCPLERRVPVYLLVGGSFLALKLIGMLWKNLQLRRYDNMDAFYDSPDSDLAFTSRTFRMMDWILSAFLLAWHVVGAYWVFALWLPTFHPSLHEPSQYCGRPVYLCAVGELVATGAVLVLLLVGCAVLALCYKYTNLFEQS